MVAIAPGLAAEVVAQVQWDRPHLQSVSMLQQVMGALVFSRAFWERHRIMAAAAAAP